VEHKAKMRKPKSPEHIKAILEAKARKNFYQPFKMYCVHLLFRFAAHNIVFFTGIQERSETSFIQITQSLFARTGQKESFIRV
jgi:hypothetical protein